MENQMTYTAFEGVELVSQGTLLEVIPQIKKRIGKSDHSNCFIFSDENGQTLDFNFQGSEKDVLKRLEVFTTVDPQIKELSSNRDPVGRGRPKLGVVAREISLLPQHWEWLATQTGGASLAIRKLIDEAKKKAGDGSSVKQSQERAYKFLSVIAGDLPGYEEALRALFKKDAKRFLEEMKSWPKDIRKHALELSRAAFKN